MYFSFVGDYVLDVFGLFVVDYYLVVYGLVDFGYFVGEGFYVFF